MTIRDIVGRSAYVVFCVLLGLAIATAFVVAVRAL